MLPRRRHAARCRPDGHSTQLPQCHGHQIFRSECHPVTRSSFLSRSWPHLYFIVSATLYHRISSQCFPIYCHSVKILASSVLYCQCHTVSSHFFSVLSYLLSQCHSRFFSSLLVCVLIFPEVSLTVSPRIFFFQSLYHFIYL